MFVLSWSLKPAISICLYAFFFFKHLIISPDNIFQSILSLMSHAVPRSFLSSWIYNFGLVLPYSDLYSWKAAATSCFHQKKNPTCSEFKVFFAQVIIFLHSVQSDWVYGLSSYLAMSFVWWYYLLLCVAFRWYFSETEVDLFCPL